MTFVQTLWLLISFSLVFSQKSDLFTPFNCDEERPKSEWTCDDYEYYLSEINLWRSLACLPHKLKVSPEQEFGILNNQSIDLYIQIEDIRELDVEQQVTRE